MLSRRRKKGKPIALRLTISYRGGDVRVESRRRVEMVAPPSHDIAAKTGESGFWYELRDSNGRVLYRRITQNPIRHSAEVLTDDPERPVAREVATDPQGIFHLIVPELAEARTLVLSSSPPDPAEAHLPAEELVQFDLTQIKDIDGDEGSS